MRRPAATTVARVAVYLGVWFLGMALLIGVYSWSSGRSPGEALGNLWIPLLISMGATVVAALRPRGAAGRERPGRGRR